MQLIGTHFHESRKSADFTGNLYLDGVYGYDVLPMQQLAPQVITQGKEPIETQRIQFMHVLINNGDSIRVFDLARAWKSDGYQLILLSDGKAAKVVNPYVVPMLGSSDMPLDVICLNRYSASNMDLPSIPIGNLGIKQLTTLEVEFDLSEFPKAVQTECLKDEMPASNTVCNAFTGVNYYSILVTKAFKQGAVAFHKLSTILLLRPDVQCMCNYSSYTCAAVEKLCLGDDCAMGKCQQITKVISLPEPEIKQEPEPEPK